MYESAGAPNENDVVSISVLDELSEIGYTISELLA